jgi:hypothetical protein
MATSTKPSELSFENERKQFLPFLLTNPNYFGNLQKSPFKPVKQIVANTTYEELKCVGFNPQLNRIEGVVWIKQPSGYDGGICTNGSLEYVSFYLSYDNGVTWLPQGTTSFRVFDVPGAHPLEYAVSLRIQPFRRFCFENNLPLVRAILSWSTPPVGPHTPPVWGNVVETRIQVAPLLLEVPFPDFLKAANLQVPAELAGLVSETASIDLQAPKALSAAELKELYAKTKVPAHRFLHATLQKSIQQPESLTASSEFLGSLGIDLANVIGSFVNTNGNTDFEQLECIGLDPESANQDALVGTILIKLPVGYSGNLCSAGSLEYVAFWLDWGGGYEWAGTASVNVHDVASIPKEGLNYAVYLPVDLSQHRKICEAGPVTAKMRAILSWNTPPPPANPNFIPVWGNRQDTLVFVDPGATVPAGNYTPFLQAVCGVAICNIDQNTGFAPGDRPFGASVSIFGYMPGAPKANTPAANRPRYQVTVQQIVGGVLQGSPQVITDPFNITIDEELGGGPVTSTNFLQMADGLGYFTYQDATPDALIGWRSISPPGLLMVWDSGTKTGLWQISVAAVDPVSHIAYPAGTTFCTLDGTTRQGVIIDLDQKAPVPALAITGFKPGGKGACQPAVNCQTFKVGDVICGSYSVSDEHFGSFSLSAEPFSGSFTVDGSPGASESYPAVPTTGKSGVWTFDTAGLPACGYTIQLSTSDRTIVSCVGPWEDNSKFVGFCLIAG